MLEQDEGSATVGGGRVFLRVALFALFRAGNGPRGKNSDVVIPSRTRVLASG